MKTNSKLVHDYAHQLFASGKGSDLYYEGPTLYSYGPHFPICHLATGHDGNQVLFWNAGKYSNTTAKHQNKAWQATRHIPRIIVPDIHAATILRTPADDIAPLVRAWRIQVERLLPGIKSTRSAQRLDAYHELNAICSDIFRFVRDFLGQPGDDPTDTKYVNWDFYHTMKAAIAEYRVNYIKSDEAAREKRREAAQAAAHTRRERRERKWAKTQEKRIRDWKDGAPGTIYADFDLLRRLPSGIIQTSQGVEMSRIEAIGLYSLITSGQLTPGFKVLDRYAVIECNAEQTRIGCHTFKTPYLIAVGEALVTGDFETLKTL